LVFVKIYLFASQLHEILVSFIVPVKRKIRALKHSNKQDEEILKQGNSHPTPVPANSTSLNCCGPSKELQNPDWCLPVLQVPVRQNSKAQAVLWKQVRPKYCD